MSATAAEPRRLAAIADRLAAARETRTPIANLVDEKLGWTDAYGVQELLRERHERGGDPVCGYKVAITSAAKLQALGLAEPLCGFLCRSGAVHDGVVSTAELIAPRIEPEIAFVMRAALAGPHCSIVEVLAATEFIVPAFEIIDTRYLKAPFDPISSAADNVSSARHVVGSVVRRPTDLDLSMIATVVSRNGEFVAAGASGSIFGHPALAVAALVRVLARHGRSLEAGSLVLTGGLVEAFNVAAGDAVQARFSGLGEVAVRFA